MGESPPDFARQATSFHLLAQIKGGKAKCPNASDPTELHGKKVRLMAMCSIPSFARPTQKTCGKRERLDVTGQQPDATATPFSRSFGLESLAFRHFALPTFICASK